MGIRVADPPDQRSHPARIRGSDQEYRIASSRSPSATVIAIHRAMLSYTARNASTRSVSSAAAASS